MLAPIARRALRRLPFTASLVAAILVTSAVTHTLARPITDQQLSHWGFDWQALRQLRLDRLFLAVLQVLRPAMILSIGASVLAMVGTCELLLGTRRTALAALAGHVAGYAGAPLLLMGLGRLGAASAAALATHGDVGASNAAFGAAGAAVLALPLAVRRPAFAATALGLLLAIPLEPRIWSVAHPIAFAAGIGVGAVALRRRGHDLAGLLPRPRLQRRQLPEVVAWVAAGMGVVDVLAALLPAALPRLVELEVWLPFGAVRASRPLLLLTGCILVAIAPRLARGQQAAFGVAMFAMAMSAALHAKPHAVRAEEVAALTYAILLWRIRGLFRAPSDPPSVRRGTSALRWSAVGLFAYCCVGFFTLRSHFSPALGVAGATREALARVALSNAGVQADTREAAWFLRSIPLLAWTGATYGLLLLLRGLRQPSVPLPDRERAAKLLLDHGRNATAAMTLWPGNALWLTAERDAYVAYRVDGDIALALGDPVGPEATWARAVAGFVEHARARGWRAAFYAGSPPVAPHYERAGLRLLRVGDEAVIPLATLEFKGKPWQDVRTAVNRARREGVRFILYEGGTLPPDVRAQLDEISREWNADSRLPPMGFTLGDVGSVDDPTVDVAVAVDASGRVHAFADWLPVPAKRGWVIDLMRRRPDAMPGVMEFLIALSMETFKERGDAVASLATAPLAGAGAGEGEESLLQRTLEQLARNLDAFYHFQSLRAFKEKFQPRWEPTLLAYRAAADLPAVALALVRAYLPGLTSRDVVQLLGSELAERLKPASVPRTPG